MTTTDGLTQLRTPIRINYNSDKQRDKFLSPHRQTPSLLLGTGPKYQSTPSPMYITPSEETEPTNKRCKPGAGSGGSAGSSGPFWDDWEEYTSGGESKHDSLHDNHTRNLDNHTRNLDNHTLDNTSHRTTHNVNPVSTTERHSAAAEEAENRDAASPHLKLSLSASISSIELTPDGYLGIMTALKLLGQGVEELRAELSVVGGIEHKVRNMETHMSNLENELSVVHDKIDDICQATVIDSSCSSSSANYIDRGNVS